jgi:hypothetical protein
MSRKWRKEWLGESSDFKMKAHAPYTTAEGSSGEVRSMKIKRMLRLTWMPRHFHAPSTLQVRVTPKKSGAAVSFHHERLPGAQAREEMRTRWRSFLERFAAAF